MSGTNKESTMVYYDLTEEEYSDIVRATLTQATKLYETTHDWCPFHFATGHDDKDTKLPMHRGKDRPAETIKACCASGNIHIAAFTLVDEFVHYDDWRKAATVTLYHLNDVLKIMPSPYGASITKWNDNLHASNGKRRVIDLYKKALADLP